MLRKILAILGVLLSLFPFNAEGKAIEGEILIPIPFVSNQLFDKDIKKNDEIPAYYGVAEPRFRFELSHQSG